MLRLIYIIMLSVCGMQALAQTRVTAENPGIDTFQVVFYDDSWSVEHKVKPGETMYVLSQKYHAPPAMIADMNNLSLNAILQVGNTIYIPFGAYNQSKTEGNRSSTRPLYYIVRKYDNLYRLAHLAGVQQKQLQEWNGMPDNYIEEGQRLFVGWVLYNDNVATNDVVNTVNRDGTLQSKYADKTANPYETVTIIKKAKPEDTISPMQRKYLEQTKDELVVTEEKGTAIFYEDKGKLSSTSIYFAFHNTANPGTIIQVRNPGTDKTIYVKVLGPIPNTKMYHNSVIGISEAAKGALLVGEDKAWCELKYAP